MTETQTRHKIDELADWIGGGCKDEDSMSLQTGLDLCDSIASDLSATLDALRDISRWSNDYQDGSSETMREATRAIADLASAAIAKTERGAQ